jgi:hypothetical protein
MLQPLESPKNNLLRNICKTARLCFPNIHTGRQCIFFDDVDQDKLVDSVNNKRGPVLAKDRLKEPAIIATRIARDSPTQSSPPPLGEQARGLIYLLLNPLHHQKCLAVFETGAVAMDL